MSSIITISFLIKAISLAMILFAFKAFSSEEESDLSLLAKYFLIKQRYRLLRLSLLFISALIIIELIGMGFLLGGATTKAQEFQLVASDAMFLVLVLVLTVMYRHQQRVSKKLAL